MQTLGSLKHYPLPTLAPQRIQLPDGAMLTFRPDVPYQAALRREAVDGSTLYAFVGARLDVPPAEHGPYLTGYVGKSQAVAGRAGVSWNYWVRAQRAIDPTGMILLHRDYPYDGDQLSVTEARVIARLATDMGSLALTNTHSSAERAASRLTPQALANAVRLGDTIAHHIWHHALGYRTNPWPAPAPNLREAAVRIVLRASNIEGRGIDLDELCQRLDANGYHSTGVTRARSAARDLHTREVATGAPRAHAVTHRGRVIYHAATLPRTQALHGYDRAHPVRR